MEDGDIICTLDCAIVTATEHGHIELGNNLRDVKTEIERLINERNEWKAKWLTHPY